MEKNFYELESEEVPSSKVDFFDRKYRWCHILLTSMCNFWGKQNAMCCDLAIDIDSAGEGDFTYRMHFDLIAEAWSKDIEYSFSAANLDSEIRNVINRINHHMKCAFSLPEFDSWPWKEYKPKWQEEAEEEEE